MGQIGEEEPGHLMASLLLSSPLQSALLQRQRKQKAEIANKGGSCFWCRFSHCNKEDHEKQLEWFAIIINAGTKNTPFLCCLFEWLHVRLWSLQTFSSSSPWQVVIHLRNNIIQAIVSSSPTPRSSRFVSRMKAVNLCTGWQEIFQHLSYYVNAASMVLLTASWLGLQMKHQWFTGLSASYKQELMLFTDLEPQAGSLNHSECRDSTHLGWS